ncbi:MAG TPA: hypothetical protein VHE35_22015 [Kofleriaceae bacterium]|nr:hypothetical protein [Kofleriaceae bacterium]
MLCTPRNLVLTLALALAGGLAGACSSNSAPPSEPPAPPPAEVPDNGLTVVDDASDVCMVNNTYMGHLQIAVDVGGTTYYGCCPACRDRLLNEPSVRTAKDPVTGEAVDKAHAVIGRDRKNVVHYFANLQNLRRYQGS